MTNDISINRSFASDSVPPSVRKKQNTLGIDLSQQSFFEELLTIGQFESTIPEAAALPTTKPFGSDSKIESDSDEEAGSEPNTEPPLQDETSHSAAVAAQAILPQIQQPTSQVLKESLTEDKGEKPLVKANHKKNGDEQTDVKNAVPAPSTVEAESNLADASAIDSTSPFLFDNSATKAADSTAAEAASQLADGETKVLIDDTRSDQAVLKSRSSTDSSGRIEDQARSESDNSQWVSKENESKSKPGIALKEFDSVNPSVEEQSKADAIEGLADQPRNKRAERLAQRASDGGSSTDERETTVDPKLELQPTQEQSPIETEFTTSASPQSSQTISTGVSTATPPIIAQPMAGSGTGATTLSSSKPNVENIVGLNSSRSGSGIQTDVANTTISGNVASPGRTDQGRGEVARSNSGTQITAYQEGKLVQRVLRGIEQLANGGGQVRLRLHPPELGALQMSLRMESGQVFAKLEVENTAARDALLNNVQTLKDRMAEQGMKVAVFEVEVSTDSAGSGLGSSSSQADGGTGNQSRWENSSSRFARQNSNRLPTELPQTERKPNAVWTRTNGSLDLTV